ncbi:hypothetical protein GQ44DRAFT_254405 [Phaeosphaeriaceae sp. PMI808]|nr:hypothetical protein GQ44DRAFT_254405 [Phaeosphaeriaceae sp. PMI808]
MKLVLVLTGLSVVAAQSPTLVSDTRLSSSQSSSSSSLSWSSTRNASSSVSTSLKVSVSTSSTSTISSSQSIFATLSASLNTTVSASPSPKPTAYINPWAGNFSSPVSQHGTGSAYALQCQNAWFSFTSNNQDYPKVSATNVFATKIIRSTTVYEVQ